MRRDAGRARTWTLRTGGTVALGAAVHQIATGLAGIRGVERRSANAMPPNVDSELRFYAAWYAAAGVLMHQAAADSRLDRQVAPVLTGGWSLAAISRLLSIRSVGRPSVLFLVLTAVEFVVAGVLAATSDEPGDDDAQVPTATDAAGSTQSSRSPCRPCR